MWWSSRASLKIDWFRQSVGGSGRVIAACLWLDRRPAGITALDDMMVSSAPTTGDWRPGLRARHRVRVVQFDRSDFTMPHDSPLDGPTEWIACPLCGADASKPVLSRIRDLLHGLPGEFDIVRCSHCAHCYLNPRPTIDALADCYPLDYGPYHAPATAQATASEPPSASPWYLSRVVRAIPGLRRLYHWLTETHSVWVPPPPQQAARALELGCSDGWFLDRLKSAGWTPVGVELSAQPARRARDRGHEVHTGTLTAGLFPEGSFDACCAWMVLEHLPDPRETLTELHRLLRPGGWLALSVPNFGCWERHVFGRYWRGLEPPRHLQHFTAPRLRKLFRETGFRIKHVIHQRNVLNLIASLGLYWKDKRPDAGLGPALLRFTDAPRMWPQLALSPLAIGLAWVRQGGRLTVIARRDG